jgi:hypothetical protein
MWLAGMTRVKAGFSREQYNKMRKVKGKAYTKALQQEGAQHM